jgi:hypothetical protein
MIADRQARIDRAGRVARAIVQFAIVAGGCAVSPFWAAAAAQHRLVALPLNDPAYVQLEALDRAGCAIARVSAYRPYLVGLIRTALDSAARDPRCAGMFLDDLRSRWSAPDSAVERVRAGAAVTVAGTGLSRGEFRPLWQDVRATTDGTPAGTVTARGRLTYEGGPRFAAVAEVVAGTHRRGETTIKQRALRNTAGYVDAGDAYLTGQIGPLVVSFGRMPEAWFGDERESVILSANGPPLDRILLEAHWRRFEVRGFAASLDEVVLTSAQDSIGPVLPQRWFRTLVGHALTWRPRPALEFSLGETAVLTRGSRTFDLSYENPIIPYLFTQNDSARQSADNRDNLSVFAATQLRLGAALVRAELLIDELQIDAADRARIDDQLAWRVRVTTPLALLSLPAIIGVDYRRVGTYTYMRGFYTEVYQNVDRPLGSELGPDADLLRGTGELWLNGKVRLSGSAGLWRHGAVRIDRRPGLRASAEGKTASFPSERPGRPEVQRGLLADASLQFLDFRLPITIRLETARLTNANNQSAPAALYVRAQLIGTYAFRYP